MHFGLTASEIDSFQAQSFSYSTGINYLFFLFVCLFVGIYVRIYVLYVCIFKGVYVCVDNLLRTINFEGFDQYQ